MITRTYELYTPRVGSSNSARSVKAIAAVPDGRHFIAAVSHGPALVWFRLPRFQWDT